MNFSSKKINRRSGKIATINYEKWVLPMYQNSPKEEITLEEFERFAVDRLKFLREIENINIRFKKGEDTYDRKMKDALENFLPSLKLITIDNNITVRSDHKQFQKDKKEKLSADMRKDHISHFILRLAFARSEDLRRWYLVHETELFRYRFQQQNSTETTEFLEKYNLNYQPISDDEKNNLIEKLTDTMNSLINNSDVASGTQFYKVPFTSVLDLVRSRRVYVHKGQAYVPEKELVSIILGIYRSHLSQALAVTARKLPYLEEDTRLLPMLKNLSSAYIGDSYTSKNAKNDQKLNLADMEETVKTSYPICMKNLHEGLRKDHHLKHFGRLQYGLFIKAAGLSLDEALMFWRGEFTKKMDLDKFEKQYAYGVRHSYGKEGKRADYTPYSCMKIITTNQPGPGDFHGCPFKHSDSESLKRRLQNYKIPKSSITDIIDLVKNQHYQVACARYFEVTHKLQDGTMSINHPNQYFDESKKVLSGGKPSMSVPINIVKDDAMETKENANMKTETKLEPAPADVTVDDFDDEMEIL